MRFVTRAALIFAMLLTLSCDSARWPPYERQIRSMFLESKPVLTEIEMEMVSDGLDFIGPGRERTRLDGSRLTDDLKAKYKNLFERLPYFWDLSRNDGTTFINLHFPRNWRVRKSFMYTITHRETPMTLPSCGFSGWPPSCGRCAVDLYDNWFIEYSWTPKDLGPEWDGRIGDGLPTPDEIHDEYKNELEECMDAGLKDLGFDRANQ